MFAWYIDNIIIFEYKICTRIIPFHGDRMVRIYKMNINILLQVIPANEVDNDEVDVDEDIERTIVSMYI